jgi:hypothetical protein
MRTLVAYAMIIALSMTLAVYIGTQAQHYVTGLYANLNRSLDNAFGE